MQKPNGYNETKAGGDYTPVTVGGHHLIIKKLEETKSKDGKPMVKIMFDMAANDSQPEYGMNEFKNDIRPEKKWPNVCTAYVLTQNDDGKCSKSFKGFTTSFEASNNCEVKWGDNFGDQFTNKKIGGVFGKVEKEYQGKRSMRTELRWFCADDKADEATVPADKMLGGSVKVSSDGFSAIPSTDALPWG